MAKSNMSNNYIVYLVITHTCVIGTYLNSVNFMCHLKRERKSVRERENSKPGIKEKYKAGRMCILV